MVESIFLENFKCFQKLNLQNFAPITLISGKNNVGKTSLLDAIYYANKIHNPNTLLDLHITRGVPLNKLSPETLWGDFIYNRDLNVECKIKEVLNNHELIIQSITQKKNNSASIQIKPLEQDSYSLNFPSLVSKISYEQKEGTVITSIVGDNSINQNHQGDLNIFNSINVIYLDTHSNHNSNIIEYFGKIDIAGDSNKIVEVLKMIEPPIKELSVVVLGGINQIFASTDNSPKKIPLKSMGDGLNRLMEMIITIIANPNSIILIDEIENGFHYSIHKNLWKVISKAVEISNSQLIATTHSYEFISSAVSAINENKMEKDFSYIRIDKEENNYIPKYYDAELLQATVENKVEVR